MSKNPAIRQVLDPLVRSLKAVEFVNGRSEQVDPEKDSVKMNLQGEQGNQHVFDDVVTKKNFCVFVERITKELQLAGSPELAYQLQRLLPEDALDELNLDDIRRWLEPSQEHEEVIHSRRIDVDSELQTVSVDGRTYGLNGGQIVKTRVADFLQELIDADGDFVPRPGDIKTRDLENQHPAVNGLVDAQPGAGSRIPRKKIWRN